jgi:hypothetical protein
MIKRGNNSFQGRYSEGEGAGPPIFYRRKGHVPAAFFNPPWRIGGSRLREGLFRQGARARVGMSFFAKQPMDDRKEINLLELRRLLYDIQSLRPDIGIRFRLMGEMWQSNYALVFKVTDSGVALRDPETRKLIIVSDLSHVMAFELETTFQQYDPHVHYGVTTARVSS